MKTAELKDKIKSIVADELERLPDTLDQLEPKERVKALEVLIKYIDFSEW